MLVDPTRVVVTSSNYSSIKLQLDRDYIIDLGVGMRSVPGAVSIWGGRNVVLENGHLNITGASGGIKLKNQTGTMWVHNLRISGPQLMEGIDLEQRQPNSAVVLRNVLIDGVYGSISTNHADLLQTWAGPSKLLVDGFSGTTTYQGFFLTPNQQFADGPPPKVFDLRHVDIDVSDGGYALWRDVGFPFCAEDIHVKPNPRKLARDWWVWPKPSTGDTSWASATTTPVSAPDGRFVRPTSSGIPTGISDQQTRSAPCT